MRPSPSSLSLLIRSASATGRAFSVAQLDDTSNAAQQGRTWGSRFARQPAEAVRAFTASIETDVALYRQDIAGSRAHVRMLAAQEIIPRSQCDALLQGLDQVEQEIAAGALELSNEREDIHTHVEARLAEIIGEEAAGWLHTGRSRNDQVALDTRLYTRDAIDDANEGILALQTALVELAERNFNIYLPGYTHLQRAQPLLLAHHLLAYFEMLDRDAARFRDARTRVDVLPLGSAALAGAAHPIDREAVAKELGFSAVSANSVDAVADRDYIAEYLAAAAMTLVHLSRLSEELVLWSSAEFGFLALDDAHTTGSSIMPQKKNPDIAELARAKSGRVMGHLVALLTTLKGLPLAYNRDLQDDKQGLFDTAATLSGTLHVLATALDGVRFDSARTQAAVDGDPFILATDYADYLVRKGLPFRKAHAVVGDLVRRCEAEGKGLAHLTLAELQASHSSFAADAVGMTAQQALAARDVPGGTAPARVRQALADARKRLNAGVEG